MKLFRVTSTKLPELYVFAHDEPDAVVIYRSFQMLLDWNQGQFEIEHVDTQPGWKQNRTLRRLLKEETRGVAKPHPIGAPKSDLGKRIIPIAPELISELIAWKLQCPPSDMDLVFPNSKGTAQLNGNLLKRMFKPLQIRASVTKPTLIKGRPLVDDDGNIVMVGKYGFHALRHAAASNWIAAKIDLKRLQVWIGHSSIQITLDTYGHLICDNDMDAELAMSSSRALFA